MNATHLMAAMGLAGLFAFAPQTASADAVADFYKNKRMTLVVGYSPGGGYDTYTRLIARHMKGHMPGKPNIIVKNMPGAGSLIAATYIGTTCPVSPTSSSRTCRVREA
jgi:tripartite-type tricarboxylate transporter receptor subunit TctC